MRRRQALLLGSLGQIALVVLIGGEALAQDGGFMVYGWGKADCRRFVEVRRSGGSLEQTLRQWVFGFVSAYNIHVAPGGDGLNGLDPAAVIERVDEICTEDPSLRISGAVNSILGGE